MSTVTMPRSTLFLETHATASAIRRPTFLERLCGAIAHQTARLAGKLLAQSWTLRTISRRNELEAAMAATLAAGRKRVELAIARTEQHLATFERIAAEFGETPVQVLPVNRHWARGDGGRFRRINRAAEQYTAPELAWFRSPSVER